MMSMTEQIVRMRRHFPRFELVFNGGWHVVWQGVLRPFAKSYLVRVATVQARKIGNISVTGTYGPDVVLLSPELEIGTPNALGETVPHIYWNERNPALSRLCLFDPATEEWSPDMAIADTTIPWTIDWLASYEGWRATGEWTGGGRHPEVSK